MLVLWFRESLKFGVKEEPLPRSALWSFLVSKKYRQWRVAPEGCARNERDGLYYDLVDDRLQVRHA